MKLRYGTPEEAGMSPARIRRIAAMAEGWVNDGLTPALVVLAARRGVIVLHEAYGPLGPEPQAPPLRLDTVFPLSSLTKVFTATCAMQLVEDGLLGLNRPLQDYLPEFEGAGKEAVMVHHLLTHTSGLNEMDILEHTARQRGMEWPLPWDDMGRLLFGIGVSAAENLRLRTSAPLSRAPDEAMSYCNLNYELLGEIVARVSGRPLDAFAEERIFGPLGMSDTSYILPDALEERTVRRPPEAILAEISANHEVRKRVQAAGSAHSTAFDMAAFGQMFLNRGWYDGMRTLSPATVAEMTRNQIPGIPAEFLGEMFSEASWGYGWEVHGRKKPLREASLHSPLAFSHGGVLGAYVWVDPAYDIVGVFLSINMAQGPRTSSPRWRGDYFVNAVTAAVLDA